MYKKNNSVSKWNTPQITDREEILDKIGNIRR